MDEVRCPFLGHLDVYIYILGYSMATFYTFNPWDVGHCTASNDGNLVVSGAELGESIHILSKLQIFMDCLELNSLLIMVTIG